MFHSAPPPAIPESGKRNARRYLRRTLLFGTGLALLWVALQLVPRADLAREPDLYTDDAGTVATSIASARPHHGPRLFTWGNLAALALLAAGGVLAVYLQRRPQRAGGTNSPIRPLGELTIGQQQQLRLVRCGDDVLLLGVTSGQITLLRTYTAGEFAELEHGGVSLEPHGDRDEEPVPAGEGSQVKRDHSPRELDGARQLPEIRSGGPGLLEHGSHFADLLRQYTARSGNGRRNGSTC